jgi:hypothetical protein
MNEILVASFILLNESLEGLREFHLPFKLKKDMSNYHHFWNLY